MSAVAAEYTLFDKLLGLLAPQKCLYCGYPTDENGKAVCESCKKLEKELLCAVCPVCGLPGGECLCIEKDNITYLFWYDKKPVRRAVSRIKHGNNIVAARHIAALLAELAQYTAQIQVNASAIARIDCLLSFASLAVERNYCRPDVNDSQTIDIREGRHPVIETLMKVGEQYVPNDIRLDDSSQQVIVITGPNMSGKSALLRQTALIVLMAQIGSYVPAAEAHIGIVDKIFTRVGASDNISQGESTFMVEMLESASILNNISQRSLVLLDEIGRGTSTYDGISIAWAMVEYIHQHPTAKAKTLFATHYHELNEMEELYERVKNYNVAVKEVDRQVIFLRKLVRGGTEHSFGIHVAKMAGMPAAITDRAGQILRDMESAHRGKLKDSRKKAPTVAQYGGSGIQLSMFQLDDPVLKQIRDEIKGLDINSLTPLEALNKLSEIKKIAGI